MTDLLSTKTYGVHHVIAPMVETPYALSKFIEAKNKVHSATKGRTEFLFNLETQTTLDNLDAMVAHSKGNIDGIVFGRVDFTLSRGLPRTAVNEPTITDAVHTVAYACRDAGLELVVGGSVSTDTTTALREIRQVRLDRFETQGHFRRIGDRERRYRSRHRERRRFRTVMASEQARLLFSHRGRGRGADRHDGKASAGPSRQCDRLRHAMSAWRLFLFGTTGERSVAPIVPRRTAADGMSRQFREATCPTMMVRCGRYDPLAEDNAAFANNDRFDAVS